MRRWLNGLYAGCGALGGVFLVAIAVLVLWQIVGGLVGRPPRAADEFAGWCMAASAFLSFPYAFRRHEHIRVTLIVQRLSAPARRGADLWALAAGAFLAGYLAWFSIKMTWQSWMLNDMSQGLVAVPMWIPQLGMATGSTVFAIAVADMLVEVIRGGRLADEAPDADATMDR